MYQGWIFKFFLCFFFVFKLVISRYIYTEVNYSVVFTDYKRHTFPQAVAQQGARHIREGGPHQLAGIGDGTLQVLHSQGAVQSALQRALPIPGIQQ